MAKRGRRDFVRMVKTNKEGNKLFQDVPPGFVSSYEERGWKVFTDAPEPVEAKPARKKKEVADVDAD